MVEFQYTFKYTSIPTVVGDSVTNLEGADGGRATLRVLELIGAPAEPCDLI